MGICCCCSQGQTSAHSVADQKPTATHERDYPAQEQSRASPYISKPKSTPDDDPDAIPLLFKYLKSDFLRPSCKHEDKTTVEAAKRSNDNAEFRAAVDYIVRTCKNLKPANARNYSAKSAVKANNHYESVLLHGKTFALPRAHKADVMTNSDSIVFDTNPTHAPTELCYDPLAIANLVQLLENVSNTDHFFSPTLERNGGAASGCAVSAAAQTIIPPSATKTQCPSRMDIFHKELLNRISDNDLSHVDACAQTVHEEPSFSMTIWTMPPGNDHKLPMHSHPGYVVAKMLNGSIRHRCGNRLLDHDLHKGDVFLITPELNLHQLTNESATEAATFVEITFPSYDDGDYDCIYYKWDEEKQQQVALIGPPNDFYTMSLTYGGMTLKR